MITAMRVHGLVTTILLSISAVSGQFLNCDWVFTLDCTTYSDTTQECGTDGLTYNNRCYFAKAQCIDKFLHILHHGECQPWEVSTTPIPGSNVDGETAVLDFFCTNLAHQDCGTDINLVCGTDGWSYLNYCEYDKARCTHRDLHVASFGACPNPPTLKP